MKANQNIIDRSSWDEISIDGWFKALMPGNWMIDDEEEVILFDPDGYGELNINFLEKSQEKGKKEIAAEVIESWAEELGQEFNYEIELVKRTKDLLIVSAELITDEMEGEVEYWKIYAVIGKNIVLDINYNCDVNDRKREEDIVDGIVDSIQISDEPNFSEALDHSEEA